MLAASARPVRPYWPHSAPDPDQEPEPRRAADCPGRCNAPFRAAEQRRADQGIEHELEPRPGEPVFCRPCVTSLRGDLTDWPELAPKLIEEIDSGVRATSGEYVSGSKNMPVHQHEAPSLLLDEAARFLSDWAATIAHDRRLAARAHDPGREPCETIDAECAFLRHHLDWHLTSRPAGEHWAAEAFGLELARLARRARVLTGSIEPEPVRIPGVPCPNCDHKTLERELEDRPSARSSVRRYVYDEAGDVEVLQRAATEAETAALRLRAPAGWFPPLRFAPTVPERHTEKTAANVFGAATGYIRCRDCRPTFRLTDTEYTRWTRMLEHDARVRGLDVGVKLARILGSRTLGSCATSAMRTEEGTAV